MALSFPHWLSELVNEQMNRLFSFESDLVLGTALFSKDSTAAVKQAIEKAGYTHIDCAEGEGTAHIARESRT